jgi:hypothetical protein
MCSAALCQIQHSHLVTISICKQYVAGKGVLGCLGDHILKEFTLCMAQIQSQLPQSFSRLLLRGREFALPSTRCLNCLLPL